MFQEPSREGVRLDRKSISFYYRLISHDQASVGKFEIVFWTTGAQPPCTVILTHNVEPFGFDRLVGRDACVLVCRKCESNVRVRRTRFDPVKVALEKNVRIVRLQFQGSLKAHDADKTIARG